MVIVRHVVIWFPVLYSQSLFWSGSFKFVFRYFCRLFVNPVFSVVFDCCSRSHLYPIFASFKMATSDLIWQIARNNHAFLMHQRGIRKTFSKEPGNLKNFNSPRYCGFTIRTSIAIQAAADGKGIVLTTTHPVGTRMMKKATSTTTMKKNSRRVFRSIRSGLKGKKVQPKIRSLALRRASAILSSQRIKPTESSKPTEKASKSKK